MLQYNKGLVIQLKKMEDNILARQTERKCPVPGCDEIIILKGRRLSEHFAKKHPEYKFHYEKFTSPNGVKWYEIICDRCGKRAKSFNELVFRHEKCEKMIQSTNDSNIEKKPRRMKSRETKICPVPGCDIPVKKGSGKLGEHFKKYHPEYKFHYEKKPVPSGSTYVLKCSVCGESAHNFDKLVQDHKHDSKDELNSFSTEVNLEKIASGYEVITLLSDLTIAVSKLISDYQKVLVELETSRENESVIKELSETVGDIIDKMRKGFDRISI